MRCIMAFAFVASLLAIGVAFAQEVPHHGHGAAPSRPANAITTGTSFSDLMDEATERMHAGMAAVRPTGNAEHDFLRMMIPHHQGAIDMAKAVLLQTDDPRIRNLAQSIVTEQQYEIDLMNKLLADSKSRSPMQHKEIKP